METEKTSLLSNGLLWFGAGVSIAEILTGTLLAPLGFTRGLAALLLGHLIGCALLFGAGLIGAKTGKSAMQTVSISFGNSGSKMFAVLNILQLVGWTAVMIIGGARAITALLGHSATGNGTALWCLIIGALILLWVAISLKQLGKLNIFAMTALFVLTIVLSFAIARSGGAGAGTLGGAITFGAAVELSVAMPLSWLPLIADYTRRAKQPFAATLTSTVVYFLTSCWMYAIGMTAAILTGQTEIALILLQAGLGVVGVIIFVLSTVTTTYLDVFSAGVSAGSLSPHLNEKAVAIIVCLVGIALAIFTPIEQFQNFLYLIGSVFAPMIAILLTDYFILHRDNSRQKFDVANLFLWLVGFIIYRLFLNIDTPVGSTLPVMIIVSLLCLLKEGVKKLCNKISQ